MVRIFDMQKHATALPWSGLSSTLQTKFVSIALDNFTVSQRIQKHCIFHYLRDDINRKVRPKKIPVVVPVTCYEKNRVGRSEKNFFSIIFL